MNRIRAEISALATAAFVFTLASGCATAAPKEKAKATAKPTDTSSRGPATHTVTRGTLTRTAQFDAIVESTELAPIRIEPKSWTDFTVLDALPHGARVKRGDRLVRLDADKLREQVEDLEQDRPGAAKALELAEAELENLTATTPQRLQTARRTRRVVDEDADYFNQVGRQQREKTAAVNLKAAQQRLDNAAEELKQLEKMYKADDLTEETEEIVLRRQKVEVEFAEFGLESAKLSTERELKVSLPREDESLKLQQREQQAALAFAEENFPLALAKRRLDVEKMRRDRRKAEKRLADLRSDLEAMEVRSPMDGLVIHGACENGKWTTGAAVGKKLVPGGKLAPFEVFMTVMNPGRLQLKGVAPEAEVGKLKVGLAGEATLVSAPERKLPVKVEKIDPLPLAAGGFEVVMSLAGETPVDLLPGLNCKLSLTNAAPAPALLAPNEAVFSEGDRRFVFLSKPGQEHEQRTVKTGLTDGKMTEITDGLQEGDRILLKRP